MPRAAWRRRRSAARAMQSGVAASRARVLGPCAPAHVPRQAQPGPCFNSRGTRVEGVTPPHLISPHRAAWAQRAAAACRAIAGALRGLAGRAGRGARGPACRMLGARGRGERALAAPRRTRSLGCTATAPGGSAERLAAPRSLGDGRGWEGESPCRAVEAVSLVREAEARAREVRAHVRPAFRPSRVQKVPRECKVLTPRHAKAAPQCQCVCESECVCVRPRRPFTTRRTECKVKKLNGQPGCQACQPCRGDLAMAPQCSSECVCVNPT